MATRTPLTLLILDGWGVREEAPDNAISQAQTPHWDRLWQCAPHSLLLTSGEAVGLPAGQMGNSEVGHTNIGAGRIVDQELTQISRAIETGRFAANPAFTGAFEHLRESGATLHLLGLLSPGGVHSHENHLYALLEAAARHDVKRAAVHAFLDGRDVAPRSAAGSLTRVDQALADSGFARLATVCGRYFAMDRDRRWERTRKAWDAIVEAQADHQADTAQAALSAAYARNESDEFVQPTLINGGCPVTDGDVVIFFNFRADRARQLSQAFVAPEFDGFQARRPRLGKFVTMTTYEEDLPADVAFPALRLEHLLGEELARAHLRQLRIAETEKYAHVTYFFNGGEETPFPGEDRRMIPSPSVATYDLKPEMASVELGDALVEAIESRTWPVIICNVANPDMVGHSGIFEAAVAAVEAVDALLGRVIEATVRVGGELLVTSDHGNVEQMTDPESGQPHTAHTNFPVPLVYLGRPARMAAEGSLRDIAPTILRLLELPVPAAMTGRNLIRTEPVAGAN